MCTFLGGGYICGRVRRKAPCHTCHHRSAGTLMRQYGSSCVGCGRALNRLQHAVAATVVAAAAAGVSECMLCVPGAPYPLPPLPPTPPPPRPKKQHAPGLARLLRSHVKQQTGSWQCAWCLTPPPPPPPPPQTPFASVFQVYNVGVGKTMPSWLSEAKKRALRKDDEFR
jgi:hypothetical protein